MDAEAARAAWTSLLSSAAARYYDLDFFGGVPLLNLDYGWGPRQLMPGNARLPWARGNQPHPDRNAYSLAEDARDPAGPGPGHRPQS